jgi:hypothetical protein
MAVRDEEATTHRGRGKGFPTMALSEAVSVIKQAGQYGHTHSLGAFAGYLGHETTNSGPFRGKMAALRDWGLIQRKGDQVLLTDLANGIAHPDSDEGERDRLAAAFRHAELFAAIYDESAKGVDLNLDLIGNRAVTVFEVAPRSKRRFAESFAKSAVSAGFAKMTSDSTVQLINLTAAKPATETGDAAGAPDGAIENAAGPGIPAEPPARPTSQTAPTLHQEWEVHSGTLIFEAHLDTALPAAAYGHIAKIADSIEQLVDFLGEPDEPLIDARDDDASE